MSNKSAQDIFNEMDTLWDNFKKATWQMSDPSDTISTINPTKEWK